LKGCPSYGVLSSKRQVRCRSGSSFLACLTTRFKIRTTISQSECFNTHRGAFREEKASGDVVNAVACAFYEHLPQRENYRPLFSSWFFPHEFENLLPVFCYHLSEQELDELKKVFYGTQKTPGNG
jgi:hypothetical protein